MLRTSLDSPLSDESKESAVIQKRINEQTKDLIRMVTSDRRAEATLSYSLDSTTQDFIRHACAKFPLETTPLIRIFYILMMTGLNTQRNANQLFNLLNENKATVAEQCYRSLLFLDKRNGEQFKLFSKETPHQSQENFDHFILAMSQCKTNESAQAVTLKLNQSLQRATPLVSQKKFSIVCPPKVRHILAAGLYPRTGKQSLLAKAKMNNPTIFDPQVLRVISHLSVGH